MKDEPMKALTVCQPYAHMIALGDKRVENRTWRTRFRGTIAIHAGRSKARLSVSDHDRFPTMVYGAIVGVATLRDVVTAESILFDKSSEYGHLRKHLHVVGPWCWVLENVRPLTEPVPYRGHLGLFNLPWEIERLVREGIDQKAENNA